MVSREQIAEIVQILAAFEDVEKVILFGSYARGTANEDSDLDLAIIQRTDLSGYQRPVKFLKALRGNGKKWLFAMDILVYTPKEFDVYQHDPYHIIHEIALTGKTLYEHKRPAELVA